MRRPTITAVLLLVPILSAMGATLHPSPTPVGLAAVGILNIVWLLVSGVAVWEMYLYSSPGGSQETDRQPASDSSSRRAA